MTQITITLDEEENRQMEIFKAQNGIKQKPEAVRKALRKFFKLEK